MKIKFLIVFIIGILFSLNTHAQSKLFPAGSTIPVVLTENISSKTLKRCCPTSFCSTRTFITMMNWRYLRELL